MPNFQDWETRDLSKTVTSIFLVIFAIGTTTRAISKQVP